MSNKLTWTRRARANGEKIEGNEKIGLWWYLRRFFANQILSQHFSLKQLPSHTTTPHQNSQHTLLHPYMSFPFFIRAKTTEGTAAFEGECQGCRSSLTFLIQTRCFLWRTCLLFVKGVSAKSTQAWLIYHALVEPMSPWKSSKSRSSSQKKETNSRTSLGYYSLTCYIETTSFAVRCLCARVLWSLVPVLRPLLTSLIFCCFFVLTRQLQTVPGIIKLLGTGTECNVEKKLYRSALILELISGKDMCEAILPTNMLEIFVLFKVCTLWFCYLFQFLDNFQSFVFLPESFFNFIFSCRKCARL